MEAVMLSTAYLHPSCLLLQTHLSHLHDRALLCHRIFTWRKSVLWMTIAHRKLGTVSHRFEMLWWWLVVCGLSCVLLFAAWWTVTRQAPLIHGIFQARILEPVAISSSRGSSWPRDWTLIFYISSIGRSHLERPWNAMSFFKLMYVHD